MRPTISERTPRAKRVRQGNFTDVTGPVRILRINGVTYYRTPLTKQVVINRTTVVTAAHESWRLRRNPVATMSLSCVVVLCLYLTVSLDWAVLGFVPEVYRLFGDGISSRSTK